MFQATFQHIFILLHHFASCAAKLMVLNSQR